MMQRFLNLLMCSIVCLYFVAANAMESKPTEEYDQQLSQRQAEALARMGWSSNNSVREDHGSMRNEPENQTASSIDNNGDVSADVWIQPNPWEEASKAQVNQPLSKKEAIVADQKPRQSDNIFAPKLVKLPFEKNQNPSSQ